MPRGECECSFDNVCGHCRDLQIARAAAEPRPMSLCRFCHGARDCAHCDSTGEQPTEPECPFEFSHEIGEVCLCEVPGERETLMSYPQKAPPGDPAPRKDY